MGFQQHGYEDEPGPEQQRKSEIVPEGYEGENKEKARETVRLPAQRDVQVSIFKNLERIYGFNKGFYLFGGI